MKKRLALILACIAIALALGTGPAHVATSGSAVPKYKITRILVEKAKRELTIYNGPKRLKSYRIALGGNPSGHKQQEGDSRTPEGNYIIDGKNPGSSFHLSLHISYPNWTDRKNARRKGVSPGGAIMIHGTPAGLATLNALGFYADWTAGCIAVSNVEIEELFTSVRVGTPITILP